MRGATPIPSHPIPSRLPQRAPQPLPQHWILITTHPADSSCCSLIILHCVQTHTAATPDGRPVGTSAVNHRPSDVTRMDGWMDAAYMGEDAISRFLFFSNRLSSSLTSVARRVASPAASRSRQRDAHHPLLPPAAQLVSSRSASRLGRTQLRHTPEHLR